ncbi:MAG: ATP-dependent DNA ligase, partial [Bauldia sp.]|nr:ATP-dependent DNA ligase [Bauldia sp.]
MQAFADFLERLVLTPQRNVKLRLMVDYFRSVADPDRGYALAALTGDLSIPSVKPAMLRALVADRVDEVLFAYSYDYVGDLAETISLVWPARPGANRPPTLGEAVERLMVASRSDGPRIVEAMLDGLDASGRWALIKLVTGGLRIGVSARLAKQALAELGDKPVNEIEEVWPGLTPPFAPLFAWLEGRAERPRATIPAPFRPVMLSHPLGDDDLTMITPHDYAAEWKWDGIRVQAVSEGDVARLYTRTGDDISAAFPDVVAALDFGGALDGELLIGRRDDTGFATGSFSELQQRLNRK